KPSARRNADGPVLNPSRSPDRHTPLFYGAEADRIVARVDMGSRYSANIEVKPDFKPLTALVRDVRRHGAGPASPKVLAAPVTNQVDRRGSTLLLPGCHRHYRGAGLIRSLGSRRN